MKTSLFLFCATLALTSLACSSHPNPLGSTTGDGAGGQGGSGATTTTTSVTGTTGAGGGAAVDPGTWKLDSNLTVNGHVLAKDLRSAVSRTVDSGQGPQMVVELTTAEGYCELLRNGGCLADGELLVTFTFAGTTKGTYPAAKSVPAEAGSVEAFTTGVDSNCTGPGIGFDSGQVTVSEATLAPGGSVVMSSALSRAFGTLGGTVTAPYCDGAVD